MMPNVQTKDGELRHTDFYSFQGIKIPFGRKTSVSEDSIEVYRNVKGKSNIKFFDIKQYILNKTPFTFHSRVLGLLEKERHLTVETYGDDDDDAKHQFRKEHIFS